MIYKTDDGYVIFSGDYQLPGCYESELAACMAFRLPDSYLAELAEKGEVITYEQVMSKLRGEKGGHWSNVTCLNDKYEVALHTGTGEYRHRLRGGDWHPGHGRDD